MNNDLEKRIQKLCSHFYSKYNRLKKENSDLSVCFFSSLIAGIYAGSSEEERELLRFQIMDIFVTIGKQIFEDHDDFVNFCEEIQEKSEN
jgi:hypothetical protein